MAKHSIIVPANFVKSVAIFASSDQSRPILTGIRFCNEGGKLVLACTDSYKLIVCETGEAVDDFEPFTIPAKALASVKAVKSSAFGGRACYIVEVDGDAFTANVTGNFEQWTSIRLLEGNYPNFRQLLPAGGLSFTVEPTCIDPALMADVCKAFASIDKTARISIATRTHKANVVECMGDGWKATAIVMPCRADSGQLSQWQAAPQGSDEYINLKARVAELECDYELAQKHYGEAVEQVKALEEELHFARQTNAALEEDLKREHNNGLKLSEELTAAKAEDERPHEWESKTLRWFDHEVEGATQCRKKGSRNFGCWFIKKATA